MAGMLVAVIAAGAADTAESAAPSATPKAEAAPPPTPMAKTTQHGLRLGGQALRYTATGGWLIMTDDKDRPIARFGYTAYTLDGVKDHARRPITFAFNGGPGLVVALAAQGRARAPARGRQ